MALAEYKKKRHFTRTPEPAGKRASSGGWSYVIQKHDASHLHYDFRLELDGVLLSWAVPKGPSLDPSVKRLAMQVEDHPVDYGSFEGIIPEGEYGGGTVLLWDQGTWEPVGDPRAGYRDGKLKFQLHGEKLHGGWMLVRTGGAHAERDRRQWLLFKERDDNASPAKKGDILVKSPRSVATGRSLEQIAHDRDWVWGAQAKSNGKPAAKTSRASKGEKSRPAAANGKKASHSARNGRAGRAHYNAADQEFAGVRLTSPDKVLYPDEGITKLELANYYKTIADWILPHIADRPLVLVRCPEGQAKECFFQKHPAAGTPDTLRQVQVREKNKTENYVIADDVAGLISLAQIGALEIHAWGSRADKLERPDRLIFDLDPAPDVPWNQVVQSARQVRQFLEELGLESFVKTTGGKGLHLVVPVDRRHDWDEAKAFCKSVADTIVAADPERYTANMSKAARPGKIFIDYLRNGRGATAIVPYSTRARPGAPVSVPLTWEELSARTTSDRFTVRNVGKRLASLKRDPWAEIFAMRQSFTPALAKLRKLRRS
jgi:bifunctional non-homologous end joining protein LigD